MKRLDAVFRIFEELTTQLDPTEYPAKKRLLIANCIVWYAEDYGIELTEEDAEYDYYTQDVGAAFEKPFEILEIENKNMRLYENSEWENDE